MSWPTFLSSLSPFWKIDEHWIIHMELETKFCTHQPQINLKVVLKFKVCSSYQSKDIRNFKKKHISFGFFKRIRRLFLFSWCNSKTVKDINLVLVPLQSFTNPEIGFDNFMLYVLKATTYGYTSWYHSLRLMISHNTITHTWGVKVQILCHLY